MTDIEQNIDTKIIEKYGDDLLNNINDSEKNIYRNFLKFAILRYDLFENKIKINNFLRKLRKLKNNNNELHNKKQIFELIDTYLGVSEVEKKQNGEVFTPFTLIEEMLDTLPEDVWSNPDLKWLDPANGIGNFPAVVLSRLMVGLKDVIKNGKERYKHIMENMIYTCDISNKNTWLYVNIFDPDNELKLNFYQGSFLEEDFDTHMINVWGINKFDIVVGNPPYQSGNNKANKLWINFIDKSLLLCNYLLFVNPIQWANSNMGDNIINIKNKMLEKQIIYICKDVNKYFNNIGENIGYFLLKNVKNYKKTKIGNDYIWFNIDNKDLILNNYDKLKFSILNKFNNLNCLTIGDKKDKNYIDKRWFIRNKKTISKEKTDKYNIKYYYTSKQIFYVDKKDIEKYLYNKVILNFGGYYWKNDKNYYYTGKNIISGNSTLMIKMREEEIDNFLSIVFSNLYKWYIKNTKTTGFFYKQLKQLKILNLQKKWNNKEIYDKFQLDSEEIDFIENELKDIKSI